MLVNIRGTFGAGKTTLARRFQTEPPEVIPLTDTVTGIRSTLTDLGAVICVGLYRREGQVEAGLDSIRGTGAFARQQAAIDAAVKMADHVICEGVMCSKGVGAWGQFFRDRADDCVLAYLDTPLDECLRRVRERKGPGGKKPFNEENVRSGHKTCWNTRAKFDWLGVRTIILPGGMEYDYLSGYLKGWGKVGA